MFSLGLLETAHVAELEQRVRVRALEVRAWKPYCDDEDLAGMEQPAGIGGVQRSRHYEIKLRLWYVYLDDDLGDISV